MSRDKAQIFLENLLKILYNNNIEILIINNLVMLILEVLQINNINNKNNKKIAFKTFLKIQYQRIILKNIKQEILQFLFKSLKKAQIKKVEKNREEPNEKDHL